MKIQFEIKETLKEIAAEILKSDKWHTIITEETPLLKRVILKDPIYDSKAYVDIWEKEIHIKTAWSNYTYRIFIQENVIVCEYIGAYRGLLEQKLLPQITPSKNILDTIVLDTSITGMRKDTLRNYVPQNIRHKQKSEKRTPENASLQHPGVIYDEFIKEGMPLPGPEEKNKY